MSAESALLRGRRFAESIMLTTCTVSRATGSMTEDPETFEKTRDMAVIYSGPCMVLAGSGNPGESPIPGAIATEQMSTLFLPVGAAGSDQVTTDDLWTCTANPTNPSLVGKTARLAGGHEQTFSTRYAYPMEVPS